MAYLFMVFVGAGAGGLVGLFMTAPFWADNYWGETGFDLVFVVPPGGAVIGSIAFPWLWYRLGKSGAARREAIDTSEAST